MSSGQTILELVFVGISKHASTDRAVAFGQDVCFLYQLLDLLVLHDAEAATLTLHNIALPCIIVRR